MTKESGLSEFLNSECLAIVINALIKIQNDTIKKELSAEAQEQCIYLMDGILILLECISENG